MAKSSALARFSPRPIIVNVPRRTRVRRAAGRAVRFVGRHARRAGRAALAPTTLAVGGLALGYADGKGYLNQLPALGGSRMVTIGVGGFLLTKQRQPWLRAIGYAALGAASYAVGKAQAMAGGTSGDGGAGPFGGV